MKLETTEILFNYIKFYVQKHGFAPSVREISQNCYVGEATVVRHLDRMQALSWISREYGKARSICIIRPQNDPKTE